MAFEGAPPGRPHPLPAPKGSRLPDQRHRDAAHAEPGPSWATVGWTRSGSRQAPALLPSAGVTEQQDNTCEKKRIGLKTMRVTLLCLIFILKETDTDRCTIGTPLNKNVFIELLISVVIKQTVILFFQFHKTLSKTWLRTWCSLQHCNRMWASTLTAVLQ